MSEARAVTNFSGNAVATLLVGTWTKTLDKERVNTVLDGNLPFDEETMVDDHLPEDERPADKQVIIEKNAAKA
jgi:aerobic C4-dicarboxylate transport protein